jgi:hypothetical protein
MNNKDRSITIMAAIFILVASVVTILDIIIGMSLSIEDMPNSALEYFNVFNENRFIGLYYFDFLNLLNVFVIFTYVILLLIIVWKKSTKLTSITFILSISGSILFILNNGALKMMNLSNQYFSTDSSNLMTDYLNQAEKIVEHSSHGSASVFYGYFVLSIANVLLALILFRTGVIKKSFSILGLIGYGMLSIYLVLVTFVFELNPLLMGIAGIAGIIVLIWQFYVVKVLIRVQSTIQR